MNDRNLLAKTDNSANHASNARLPHRKNNSRQWVVYFLMGFIGVAVGIAIIAPSIRVLGSRYELEQARTQWLNNKPASYRITTWQRGFIDEPEPCLNLGVGYIITVTNGAVVGSNAPSECKVVYEQLTIETSFDRIDQALRNTDLLTARPVLEVDPTYHWIVSFFLSHDKNLYYKDFKILDAQASSILPAP